MDFRWEKDEEGGASEQEQQPLGAAGAAAADAAAAGSGEFGELAKQVHSAVEHAHAPGSPTAHPAAGATGEQAVVAGVDLTIPFRLAPADCLRTPFTNHVKGYQGLLDYIW